MIQLIDRVDCDGLQKSIVKPEAFKKAVLVQDAGSKDDLFALLMVDDKRAARLNTIAHVLSLIPYKKLPDKKVKLPRRSSKNAYDDAAAIARRRFVAERY